MDTNLISVREAAAIARDDLAEALPALRRHIASTTDKTLIALFARVEGDFHELTLLHKRELSIIETGREPQEEGAVA